MKRIITISGLIGSGKSSVARSLESLLGFPIVGTGSIQREIAKNRGLTTLELNQLSITDSSIDDEIDNFVIELGKSREQIIIDSRLAWHFIPEAFKAFLIVDPLTGARRVFGDQRAEENNPSLEEALANNLQRQQLEQDRFKTLYGVDFQNFGNYDVLIDTSYTPPAIIAEKLAELFQQSLRQEAFPKLWVNAKRLLPTRDWTRTDFSAKAEAMRRSMRDHGFDYARPVEVAHDGDDLLVADGHQRAAAAHAEGVSLIPCRLVDKPQLKSPRCAPETFDWETIPWDWLDRYAMFSNISIR